MKNTLNPLLIDIERVSEITSLAKRTIARRVAAGDMPKPRRIGGRRLWSTEELTQWVRNGCSKVERRR